VSLSDIRRRLAALEQATTITRLCIAFPPLEGAEFLGYSVAPMFVQAWHDPDESFTVLAADREECARLAHSMADTRWLKDRLLTVRLDPLTRPPTHR